ncbi:hypothetical protein JCM16358_06850 [Halanaerocella petrolearia]
MIEIKEDKIEIKLDNLQSKSEVAETVYKTLEKQAEDRLKPYFLNGVEWLPIISFILGTVTSGFLKEIGSEVWKGVKKFFRCNSNKEKIPKFEISFNYQGVKVKASLENTNQQTLESALDRLGSSLEQAINQDEIEEMKFIMDLNGKWHQQETD